MTALLWRLARRILLPRGARTALAIGLLTAPLAVLVAGASAVQALTLTGEQVAVREMGQAQLRVAVPWADAAVSGPVAAVLPDREHARVEGVEFPVDTALGAYYLESAWGTPLERDRLRVVTGKMPTRPGETLVSGRLAALRGLDPGDSLTLLDGRLVLTVSGIAENPFGYDGVGLFPASGTIAPLADQADLRQKLSLQTHYLVTGLAPDQVDRLRAEVEGVLVTVAPELPNPVLSRAELLAGPRSVIDREPALVAIPGLLIPLALSTASMLSQARRQRRALALLDAVGLPPRSGDAVAGLAAVTITVAGAVTGTTIGLVTGWAMRPLLSSLGQRDLSPYQPPWGLVLWLMLTTALGAAVVVLLMRRAARGESVIEQIRAPALRSRYWVRPAVRVTTAGAVVFAILGILGFGGGLSPAVASLALGAAAVLTLPAVLAALPELSARVPLVTARYTVRRLARERSRATGVAGCALLVVVGFAALAVVEDSLSAADRAGYVPSLLPGQILLNEALSGRPLPDDLIHEVSVATGTAPITLRAVGVTPPDGVQQRDWRVVEPVRPRGGPRGIRVIDDADHFAPIFGRPPSDAERAALVAGKAVSWNGAVVDDTLIVGAFGQITEPDQALPEPVETRALPALAASMTEYGRRRDAAVITTFGAAAAGLPVGRIGTLFPSPAGDTDERVAAVRKIVDSGGSAFTLLQLHEPYQQFPSPARQVIGQLGGWLVFAVAVLLFGQMSRSRGRDLNTLFSLGVPRRFQLITSGIEAVILGCYAVVGGLLIGILAAGLRIRLTGAPIAIEWVSVLPFTAWVSVAMLSAAVITTPRQRRYVPGGVVSDRFR